MHVRLTSYNTTQLLHPEYFHKKFTDHNEVIDFFMKNGFKIVDEIEHYNIDPTISWIRVEKNGYQELVYMNLVSY